MSACADQARPPVGVRDNRTVTPASPATRRVPLVRIATWLVACSLGVYLSASGIIGIFVKAGY